MLRQLILDLRSLSIATVVLPLCLSACDSNEPIASDLPQLPEDTVPLLVPWSALSGRILLYYALHHDPFIIKYSALIDTHAKKVYDLGDFRDYISHQVLSPDGLTRAISYPTANLELIAEFPAISLAQYNNSASVPNWEGICPAWSADGKLTYWSSRNADTLYVEGTPIGRLHAEKECNSWGPDGTWFMQIMDPDTIKPPSQVHWGVYRISISDFKPRAVLVDSTQNWDGVAVSPDGKLMAVGRADGIYVASIDGTGLHRLMGAGVGNPTWSPDGKTLLVTGECSACVSSSSKQGAWLIGVSTGQIQQLVAEPTLFASWSR